MLVQKCHSAPTEFLAAYSNNRHPFLPPEVRDCKVTVLFPGIILTWWSFILLETSFDKGYTVACRVILPVSNNVKAHTSVRNSVGTLGLSGRTEKGSALSPSNCLLMPGRKNLWYLKERITKNIRC